jgi:DNA-binding transcriptional LysR family regulator
MLIMHETDSAPRKAIENYIRKNGLQVEVHLELSSNRAIKRAVEDGLGIALISRKVANEEIVSKRLMAIPLSDPTMTRRYYMVHHKDKYLSESLQNFIDMVLNWSADYAQAL